MPNTKLAIKYNGNSINHTQKHNIMKQILANKSILNILFKKSPTLSGARGGSPIHPTYILVHRLAYMNTIYMHFYSVLVQSPHM